MTERYRSVTGAYRAMYEAEPPATDTGDHLNEVRLVRAGSVLALAAQAKNYGNQIVKATQRGKQELTKVKREEQMEAKIYSC